MVNTKLIALDIGGTLLSDNNTITNENINVLKKAKKVDKQVCFDV